MNPFCYQEPPFHLVKTTVRFIVWFSVFTFFLSNSSWLSSFLQSFFSHLSSFPSLLVAHINNKNCIFLLCNGILVILVKSSRKNISGNSATSTVDKEAPPEVETGEETKALVLGNRGAMIETKPEMGGKDVQMVAESQNGDEFCIEVEKDVEEDGSIAKLSTEELNIKFDEFIRRMKEEIRFEAQQQLIMV